MQCILLMKFSNKNEYMTENTRHEMIESGFESVVCVAIILSYYLQIKRGELCIYRNHFENIFFEHIHTDQSCIVISIISVYIQNVSYLLFSNLRVVQVGYEESVLVPVLFRLDDDTLPVYWNLVVVLQMPNMTTKLQPLLFRINSKLKLLTQL